MLYYTAKGVPCIEVRHWVSGSTGRSKARSVQEVSQGQKSGQRAVPILERYLNLTDHHLCTLTHLQFASVQLQELWPIHLPGSKLGSILFQVEAVKPLAHLLAGPVLYSREGLIQEL